MISASSALLSSVMPRDVARTYRLAESRSIAMRSRFMTERSIV
jgi:hypothetical protein